jgi:hypothetical protein
MRSVVACQKIQGFFLDKIETPLIVVKDLEHTVQVHTFRHRILTQEFRDLLHKNKDWMFDEDLLLNAIAASPAPVSGVTPVPVKRYYAKDLIGDFENKTYDVKTIQAIRTLEHRLEKRYVRECEVRMLSFSCLQLLCFRQSYAVEYLTATTFLFSCQNPE